MSIAKLIMTVGLPGSGKSYFAEQYVKDFPDTIIHSSDAIREELSGDANNQDVNTQVFDVLHNRVIEDLTAGKTVIYDATNISYKKRKAFLEKVSKINCFKECCVICTPYDICIDQNNTRERKVPENVIKRMYMNFDIPWYYEGWNSIKTIYLKPEYNNYKGTVEDFLNRYSDFNQYNSHHTETLGDHCFQTGQYMRNSYKLSNLIAYEMITAALLHDCGKPFTKTFVNTKGERTEEAHYYQHHHCGSYDSLFYELLDASCSRLIVALLIRWHMLRHNLKNASERTKSRYRKLFNSDPYSNLINLNNCIEILSEADVKSH